MCQINLIKLIWPCISGFKQTYKSQLGVCLSMYDLLLQLVIKGLKSVLEIFKE